MTFIIKYEHEDEDAPHYFLVNGEEVACFDYDTHGWQAISDAVSMFKAIAKQMGQEVTYNEGEE
jgi:hypothetical protein